MVTIRIPAPSSMLLANVLAVLGLAGVSVAIGGLAGMWWGLLAASVLAVGVAAVAMTYAAATEQAAAEAPAVAAVPQPFRAAEEPAAA